MFGFLKRLLGGLAKIANKRRAVPVDPVVSAPVAVAPVVAAPVVAAPPEPVVAPVVTPVIPLQVMPEPVAYQAFAPAEPEPTLLSWDVEDFDMVQSVSSPDAYMIGLIGEEDHAAAVADLVPGMAISLQLEPSNPHDSSAIAAVDGHDRVIGYIAPDSWLREAVYGGGAGFSARVLATEMGSRGFREVVLEVEPAEEELRERRYRALI